MRRELAERGYLEGRVGRFVLAGGSGVLPGARHLAGTALRAALLGAPVLGALLTLAVAAAWPGAGAGRVLLVLWGYMSAVAFAALLILDLVAAGIGRWLAGRHGARPGDRVVAGLIVALPCIGYLVLLWAWHRPQRSPGADLAFLGASVAVMLLVAWLAGLVSLAGIVCRSGHAPRRRGARALVASAAALGLLGAGGLWVAEHLAAGGGPAAPAPPFEPAPGAWDILVLGIDGLGGELVAALEGRRVLDGTLGRMRGGAVWPVARGAGAEPAEVWTTLMTGMTAAAHGVRSAGAERLPGIPAPVSRGVGPAPLEAVVRFLLPSRTVPASGAQRRVLVAWEVLGLEVPAAAVGWWASWPADRPGTGGWVVSDRALARLLAGRPGDRDTAPSSLFDRLSADFERTRAGLREGFESWAPEGIDEPVAGWMWESWLIDGWNWSVARRLSGDPGVRATFVYLPGLEILRARLENELRSPGGVPQALTVQQAIEAYAGRLDRLVAEAAGVAETLVLVGDPGRHAGAGDAGFVAVSGTPAVAGCTGEPLSPLDVLPLLLRLAGFPQSEELPGRPPRDCLEPGRTARPPVVATFGRRVEAGRPAADPDAGELLERLRSLGYVD